MSDPHPDDQALKDYLHGGSVLSQLYRQGTDEQPPAHLDAAILAAARQATAAPVPRPGRVPLLRWAVPLSLAAVLVLSVSLVTLMEPHTQVTLPPSEAPESAAPAPAEHWPVSPPAPASGAGPAGVPQPQTRVPAPEAVGSQRAAPAAAERRPASRAPSPALDAGAGARKSATEPAARAAPEPRPMEALPGRTEAEESVRQAVPGAASEDIPDREAAPVLAPEAWLHRIDELRRQGREAEARASLAEFRRRYPAFPLPPELQP